jgi:hypothetical protein
VVCVSAPAREQEKQQSNVKTAREVLFMTFLLIAIRPQYMGLILKNILYLGVNCKTFFKKSDPTPCFTRDWPLLSHKKSRADWSAALREGGRRIAGGLHELPAP